jgi:hypothetical protein
MLGLNIEQYIILLKHLKQAAKTHQPFLPVHLPLQDEMLYSIQTTFTDFYFRETLIDDSYIVNHHLERDRTEVTDARNKALIERRFNRES